MTTVKDLIRDFGMDLIRHGVENADNFNVDDEEYCEEKLEELMDQIRKGFE